MMKNKLTQEYVQSLFDYHNGDLYWKVKRQRIKIGDKAGTLNKQTHRYQIGINYKYYQTHQLIYLYHYGYIPKEIDHIDNNHLNNNIKNLRPVTRSQNNMNRIKLRNTSSKFKGVCWNKQLNKWEVGIKINNKKKYLGLFKSETDAAIAYNNAAIELFGEYANLNEV